MKSISTLVDDIYDVIEGLGGWNESISKFMADEIFELCESRFSNKQKERDYLSLSSVGNPCPTELWYRINLPKEGEKLSAEALGTFFYGDLLEVFLIACAKAAGHSVTALQEEVEVFGVPGHIDCIIDGWLVDVKSASKYGFQKFEKNALKEDDPFGYISQLSSYLYALQKHPNLSEKYKAAFLVVKKDRFKLKLDVYDLREEMKNKEQEIKEAKRAVSGKKPDFRIEPIDDGKSGNKALAIKCQYCSRKHLCWPEMRTFIYSTGPKHLVKVVREPKVPEVKNDN